MVLDLERKERGEALGEKRAASPWQPVDMAAGQHLGFGGCTLVSEPHFPAGPITQPAADAIIRAQRRLYELALQIAQLLAIETEKAVTVHGASIKFNPAKMELGRYYLAQLGDEPYLLRKVSEDVVDVYGLAEQG